MSRGTLRVHLLRGRILPPPHRRAVGFVVPVARCGIGFPLRLPSLSPGSRMVLLMAVSVRAWARRFLSETVSASSPSGPLSLGLSHVRCSFVKKLLVLFAGIGECGPTAASLHSVSAFSTVFSDRLSRLGFSPRVGWLLVAIARRSISGVMC